MLPNGTHLGQSLRDAAFPNPSNDLLCGDGCGAGSTAQPVHVSNGVRTPPLAYPCPQRVVDDSTALVLRNVP